MKTKNLMTAFALSTVFAACTQDTELNETLAKNDFSNIPMVEAEFTVNTGVDSRMATKFGWEVGDKVGFAWLGGKFTDKAGTTIDTGVGHNGDGKLFGTAYQNHPLFCTDATNAAFKTETMLYVGNYFAYMPYNANDMNVGPVVFNVNNQTLSTNADDLAKSAIYISPKLTTLEKENIYGQVATGNDKAGMGKNLPLNIARVSNAATINLSFANTDGLTGLKVHGVSLDVLDGTTSLLPKSFKYAPTATVDITGWKNYSTTNFYKTTTSEVGAIAAANKDGIAVTNNALTVYMLTMPATKALAATHTFEVVVSTNYGDVTVKPGTDDADTFDFITFTEGTSTPSDDFTTSNLFKNFASAGTINVYVDMANIAVTGGVVKTQAELEARLNSLVVSGYEGDVAFTIKPDEKNRKENFVFTDFTLPEGLKTGKITLNAGSTVTNGFVFNGNTVVNKVLDITPDSEVNGTMTVNCIMNEYGTAPIQTLGGGLITINNGAKFVNNGIVSNKLKTVKYDSKNKIAAGLYVSNYKYAQSGVIANEGEVQWIAGTLNDSKGVVFANVIDFATLNAAGGAKVNTARFVENVTFTNSGRNVNVDKAITKIEVYGNVTINVTKDDFTGKGATINFQGLKNTGAYPTSESAAVVIKENAKLTITSDMPYVWDDKDEDTTMDANEVSGNKIDWGTSTVMESAKNTELSFTKTWFDDLMLIKHAGKITSTNANFGEATFSAVGDGEHTSGN